jgi:hypothetical protein
MLGFTDIISKIVQGLRITELNLSERFRLLLFFRVVIGKFKQPFALQDTFSTLRMALYYLLYSYTSVKTTST